MKPIQTGLKVHRQISLKTAETVKKYTETNGKADESSQAADKIIRIKTKAVPQADKVPRRVYRVVKTFKRNVKHANRSRKALKETEQEIVKNSRDIKRTIKKVKAVHNARIAAESLRTARKFTESRNPVHKVKVKQNTVKQANKKYIKTAERYGANRIKKHTPHVKPGRAVSASHGRSVKSAAQCGYIDQGVFPMFSYCPSGIEWFKSKGMWTDGSSMPRAGDIIFFDWNGDGVSDHVGIVEFVSNETVHTIEGNSGDAVVQNTYDLGNSCIMGYGMLAQISGLNGDTVEEQCYNYLRAEGYSEIAACAVIANFQGECNCDPGIYGHDYGDAAGIMQWTGPNKTIFFNWCNDNAMNWTNLESQLYFYSYWLNDVNNGEWSRISGSRHPDFQHVYSTEEFKQISADTYGGDIARALYEATAMFVDDMERPYDTWGAETRRYTYSVQFYNYLVAGGVDGTTQSAWRPEYANDIGVFHLN